MSRSIEISAPSRTIDNILERIGRVSGVVSLSRQKRASLSPPGNVLTIYATDDATRSLLAILADLDASVDGTISMSEPTSLLSSENQHLINKESNETVWDDMAFLLRKDTNLSSPMGRASRSSLSALTSKHELIAGLGFPLFLLQMSLENNCSNK
ncbi:hypothetical protein [Vreelandella nanhaiensis]|uniref:Uncharacterized protein n=1 Tax=Vreelandella nanhaiensis TaxID=1258546 RepID=A0A3S0WA20_9GAMM|nr:hypothetical protein [Halomonas nanhaiensis]RUR32548.1 hypothetical protein ELY38_06920 [Halomonas nanhaiensis]